MSKPDIPPLQGDESFRLDKYFAGAINQITHRLDVEDEALIRNIIYHVSKSYEHSLFGYGTLDPTAFAKEWKYDPANLRRIHPSPFQLTTLTDAEIERYRTDRASRRGERTMPHSFIWDTMLENALFILANKPVSLNKYRIYQDNEDAWQRDMIIKQNVAFTVFTKIGAVAKKRGGYVYTYTLNPHFEQNLTKYFTRALPGSIIAMRSRNLDPLYLYLKNLKTNLSLNGFRTTRPGEPSFEYLCDQAGITRFSVDGKNRRNVRKVRFLLSEALRFIQENTELKFSVSWARNDDGDGADLVPVIDFGESAVMSKLYSKVTQDNENVKIYRQVVGNQLREMYTRLYTLGTYTEADINDFNEWLFNENKSRSEKEIALRFAFIRIFGKIPDDARKREKAFFELVRSISQNEPKPTIEMLLAKL